MATTKKRKKSTKRLETQMKSWVNAMNGATMAISAPGCGVVHLVTSRSAAAELHRRGEVTLSPRELMALLASGGGRDGLAAAVAVKRVMGSADVTVEMGDG